MKKWQQILVFILLSLFLILIISLIVNKINESKKSDPYRNIFKRTNMSCNIYLPSKSPGLVLDSIIVCNKTKSLPAKPSFVFEDFNSNEAYQNEFIFVNMDTTNFEKLLTEETPHYVLCKTKQAYNILKSRLQSKEVVYTGFTSIDRLKKGYTMDYNKFIHIAGKSPFKGTTPLIKAWIKNPQFPILKIVCNNFFGIVDDYKKLILEGNCKNIELIDTFVDDDNVEELYNTHGIHMCPSKHEGWGHYIAEAKSCKAVVLYTDAPSMNETFINEIDGIAIPSTQDTDSFANNGLCPVYNVTVDNIEQTVLRLLQIPVQKRAEMGNNARNRFLQNDTNFQSRLLKYIKGERKIPKLIHRVWLDKNKPYDNAVLPSRYNKYITVWKEYNTEFVHKLWSGRQVIELIKQYFPQYEEFYRSLNPFIKKCDFARFVIVYVYGGFYADIDFYCKRNISYLTEGGENYFIREPKEHFIEDQELLCNGFFGACKQNEFVLGWIENMVKNSEVKDVLRHTGPIGFDTYSKNTKNKMLLGNTCDILSVISSFKFASDCDSYNYGIATLWFDGTDWDENGVKRDTNKVKEILNPIDSSNILIDITDESVISEGDSASIVSVFNSAKKIHGDSIDGIIIYRAYSGLMAIALAMALKNDGRENVIVYAFETDKSNCELIEKASMLNFLNNIKIIRNDFINQTQNKYSINYASWNEFTKSKKMKRLYYSPDTLYLKNQIGNVSIIYVNENHQSFLNGCKEIISKLNPVVIRG